MISKVSSSSYCFRILVLHQDILKSPVFSFPTFGFARLFLRQPLSTDHSRGDLCGSIVRKTCFVASVFHNTPTQSIKKKKKKQTTSITLNQKMRPSFTAQDRLQSVGHTFRCGFLQERRSNCL